MKKGSITRGIVVVGLDLGDKFAQFCGVDKTGEPIMEKRFRQTPAGFTRHFKRKTHWKVVIESGTPTRWVKKKLEELGHEVKVVNPRKMRRIYENENKSDVVDARELANAGLYQWHRLPEVTLRSDVAQSKLTVLKTRDLLIKSRSSLTNQARSILKQEGIFPPKCTPAAAPKRFRPIIPAFLELALEGLLQEIESLTAKIKELDEWIEEETSKDPAIRLLRQVHGVGPVTAAAYIWTIDEPDRVVKSRKAGSFLGVRPRRSQSGETDKQLRITKAGNGFLRRLLVNCAQYILGPHGPDSELKRWGLKLAARGGKIAKRKAAVAVARKLAVILHHLWVTGELYEAFPNGLQAAACN